MCLPLELSPAPLVATQLIIWRQSISQYHLCSLVRQVTALQENVYVLGYLFSLFALLYLFDTQDPNHVIRVNCPVKPSFACFGLTEDCNISSLKTYWTRVSASSLFDASLDNLPISFCLSDLPPFPREASPYSFVLVSVKCLGGLPLTTWKLLPFYLDPPGLPAAAISTFP